MNLQPNELAFLSSWAKEEKAPDPYVFPCHQLQAAHQVRGVTSDGATGLEAYRRRYLPWVSHQRCVFHLWRGLAGAFAQGVATATAGLTGGPRR